MSSQIMNPGHQTQQTINPNLMRLLVPILPIDIPEYHQDTTNKDQLQIDPLTLTKRSDDAEFQDWQIMTIRSGKFVFREVDKPSDNAQSPRIQKKGPPSQLQHKPSLVKLTRHQSIGKPQKYHSRQESRQSKAKPVVTLQDNKLLKTIFVHFCKFNHISSIKSTLFEEKEKSMSEMSLNKWMVFCKQFDIFSKLCSFKSSLKEQVKLKIIKQVQNCLCRIYKKASQNKSKMDYSQFIQAIRCLYEQFKAQSSEQAHISQQDFVSSFLYCSSEAQCLRKLSQLKFSFGTPQIDYAKKSLLSIPQTFSKSRFNKSQSKENKSHKCKVINSPAKKTTKMTLNPILSNAKSSFANLHIRPKLQIHRNYISNTKLTIDSKRQSIKKGKSKQSRLLEMLDSSKDDILESYFKVEKLTSIG